MNHCCAVVISCLLLAGCPVPPGGGDAGGAVVADASSVLDAGLPPLADAGPGPGDAFNRYCGARDWHETLEGTTVGRLSGSYLGVLTGPRQGEPWDPGTLETMKFVPPHPFRLDTIRVALAGTGTALLRLMTTFGRTYPAPYPRLADETYDLMPPVAVETTDADPEQWIDVDVSWANVFLVPDEHYLLVYEHLYPTPYLAVESVPAGDSSRALLFIPTSVEAYGLDGNYRLELTGRSFCAWGDGDRWFGKDGTQPWSADVSARVAVTDFNRDGHLDVVTHDGNPRLYLGDGRGGFAVPSVDPLEAARGASLVIFADVDNDGDEDVFAAPYVGWDNDGDGFLVTQGDCNDAEPGVHPGATELPNGRDDDCDGVADDGTATADGDGDGVSPALGDCDDTRDDVFPGAPELLDGRDNDCDGTADEDFVNRVLLNDGTGRLSAVENAGVAWLDPSTAGGFGDGNQDGCLDLYWGNWLVRYPEDPSVQDRYVEGRCDGTFRDALAAAGMALTKPLSCYGVEWTDYNNDGIPDVFVGNYHLYDNQLWKGLGDGGFVDVAPGVGLAHDDIPSPYAGYPGGHTYGGDWGDVDHDGDMDFYMCNLSHPRTQPWADPSMLGINQGPPSFSFVNQRAERGLIYDEGDVNAVFGDYDNDGDLDLAVASLYTGHYARLYRNDGGGHFSDVTYESGTSVHDAVSVVWADVDEDGDLDLLLADRAGAPYVHLFTNRLAGGAGWVEVDLEGTTTNRDAVGARLTLTAGGVTHLRDVSAGWGHANTQKPRRLHVGLGTAAAIDSATVHWVGGATETITGLAPGGIYVVREGIGVATRRP